MTQPNLAAATPRRNRARVVLCTALLSLASTLAFAQQSASPGADTFRSLMDTAMERMDHGMAVPYSDDPDRDFAAMMIPHHQGAVDMAEAELRFGHDERLRRLAQAIIVEQRQEIAVMQQILSTLPPAPASGTTPMMHDMHSHTQSKDP
jgi:Domain of unknown function (DUF305)